MNQRTIFDADFAADMDAKRLARRSDPPTSKEAAAELVATGRLSRECRGVLERLQQGRQSSRDLAAVSLKYTARISDLRAAGYEITAERTPAGWWYVLKPTKGEN